MVRNRLLLAIAISFIALASMLVWMTWMPGESYRGPLRLTADDEAVAARLRLHVAALATSPRSLWADGLERSVEYLSGQIREMGYEPVLHTYEISGTPVSNVEVELRGNALP